MAAPFDWDASPYQVRVWYALEPAPRVRDLLQSHLPRALEGAAHGLIGPVWDLRVSAAPLSLATDIYERIERVDLSRIEQADPEILQADKLILIGVRDTEAAWTVSVREFDVRTRQWGTVVTRPIFRDARGAMQIADLAVMVFSPVGRVEQVDEKNQAVRLRMRGGLLLSEADALGAGKIGSLYQPLIRHNDRRGDPRPNGIVEVPWTVLEATAVKQGLVECRLHSGRARPLRTARSHQVEQLALLMHPSDGARELQLVASHDRQRPLTGYRVLAVDDRGALRSVGETDSRGIVVVPSTRSPLQILYVQSGTALLARLPLVAAGGPRAVAPIFDNRLLLEAEGYLQGFQQRLIDLVAQRTLLASRIRQLLKDQKRDEARRLWDELRELPTASQLLRELDDRDKQWATEHKRVQQRLSQMLRGARQQVNEHLGTELVDTLRRELG